MDGGPTASIDPGVTVGHVHLKVADIDRSLGFYRDVLGAELVREYGGSSAVFSFNGAWLLLVTGGGPTEDKPTVSFAAPGDPDTVSHAMTIRVTDGQGAYETLRARGATFLTPPVTSEWEVRAFFRDPDGHLLEISEFRGAS